MERAVDEDGGGMLVVLQIPRRPGADGTLAHMRIEHGHITEGQQRALRRQEGLQTPAQSVKKDIIQGAQVAEC
eukprot:3587000-Lingulodinium_polyedra.AAC.1